MGNTGWLLLKTSDFAGVGPEEVEGCPGCACVCVCDELPLASRCRRAAARLAACWPGSGKLVTWVGSRSSPVLNLAWLFAIELGAPSDLRDACQDFSGLARTLLVGLGDLFSGPSAPRDATPDRGIDSVDGSMEAQAGGWSATKSDGDLGCRAGSSASPADLDVASGEPVRAFHDCERMAAEGGAAAEEVEEVAAMVRRGACGGESSLRAKAQAMG